MDNQTNIQIPKKYEECIKEIYHDGMAIGCTLIVDGDGMIMGKTRVNIAGGIEFTVSDEVTMER